MPDPQVPTAGGQTCSAPPYRFQRQGRSRALVLLLSAWFLGLILMWLVLGVLLWILVLLALPIGPALWDLWRNPISGLTLDHQTICWFTGTRKVELPLQDLMQLRLDRRWDFSFRATLILQNGRKLRLPQAATPPADDLEQAMAIRAVPSQRHHFSVF